MNWGVPAWLLAVGLFVAAAPLNVTNATLSVFRTRIIVVCVPFMFNSLNGCPNLRPNDERSHAGPLMSECKPDARPALADAGGSTFGQHVFYF
jgi:hypothetical protein